MTTWSTIHILNASPDQMKNADFVQACARAYNAMKAKRAEAIEAALSVQGVLDLVLLDLLVGKDAARRATLREMVLAAEFCTSFQKWKMLKQFMSSEPNYFSQLSAEEAKKLREELHALLNDRNKFAHGDLMVDASDYSVAIRYYESGTKYMKVTNEFLNQLIGRALRSREVLFNLHQSFGTDLQTAVLSV